MRYADSSKLPQRSNQVPPLRRRNREIGCSQYMQAPNCHSISMLDSLSTVVPTGTWWSLPPARTVRALHAAMRGGINVSVIVGDRVRSGAGGYRHN